MESCPHTSVTDGWCDRCGIRVAAAPSPSGNSVPGPPPEGAAPAFSSCPSCDASWEGGRFCEVCGYDRVTGGGPPPPRIPTPSTPTSGPSAGHTAPPPQPAPQQVPSGTWTAVVWADPAYYQAMVEQGELDPEVLTFPSHYPQRRVQLTGERMLIGRRSRSRGIFPEIDLGAGAGNPSVPGDPAVSGRHAELLAQPDGSWVLVDLKSTNGTKVNQVDNRVTSDVEIPLSDGDRIYLGAWTVITLEKG